MITRSLVAALLVGGALAAAACSPAPPKARGPIVEEFHWGAPESLRYDLVARGGEIDGHCELTTEESEGALKLSHLCSDSTEMHRDDRTATVDPVRLAPISSQRVIANLEDNKRTSFTSQYSEDQVALTADQDGEVNDTTRDLPDANDDVPEPAWYDDETLFWIVRSVPLREGFKGTYTNVNAANGRVFDVEVEVDGTERITVPAGEFDCWTVRIETDSVVQRFWIERSEPNKVIRARIERINYELVSSE